MYMSFERLGSRKNLPNCTHPFQVKIDNMSSCDSYSVYECYKCGYCGKIIQVRENESKLL